MAAQQIGGDGALFLGEDKAFVLSVTNRAGIPVDVSTWTIKMLVKLRDSDADASAVLDMTGAVSGVFNADPLVNSQIVTFVALDTETELLNSTKTYSYSCKRKDDGSETILAYGPFVIERTSQIL